MAGRTIHFPLNTLALKRGGLVKAVRDRASALAAAGHTVTIDTLGGQAQLEVVRSEMARTGQLHPDVGVRDVLLALAPHTKPAAVRPWAAEAAEVVYQEQGGRVLRTFVDGVYTRYVRYMDAAERRLDVIEHFGDNRRRYLREEFDPSGRVVKRLDYVNGSKYPTCRRFFDQAGECYLSIWADPDSGRWSRAFLHSEGKTFASMTELYAFAFTRLLAPEEHPALTSEFRDHLPNFSGKTFDDAFLQVEHPDLLKVAVVHSNHLKPPHTRGAPMAAGWGKLFGRGAEVDQFVVWTESQAQDIQADEPAAVRVSVCPPVSPPPVPVPRQVVPGRLVMVARIDPKKRVDMALRVVAEVRKTHPHATLDIYGFGYEDALAADIRRQVVESGLRDAVNFRPFASGLDQIYDGAEATLFTSLHEGLGLVLLESMSRGVPVVATDANYGPRDILRDGENGYLLGVEDESGVVAAVKKILDDPAGRQVLVAGALRTVGEFTPERFLEYWENTLLAETARTGSDQSVASVQFVERTSSSPNRVPAAVSGWARTGASALEMVHPAEHRVLVLRRRSDSVEITRVAPQDGLWSLDIPAAEQGPILDLYLLGSDGVERRVDAVGELPARCGRWILYATAHGVLSLKRA